MGWNGKARFGVSVVYKVGGVLGEMRFTNLTEQEARDTLDHWGNPNDITTSKENRESQAGDTLEQAQELANRLRAELGFNRLEFNRTRKRVSSEFDQEIGLIRKALKQLCPTLSVRRGKGTAYSWIEIQGSKEFGEFTEDERRALEKFGLNCGGNMALVSPDDRRRYVEKAAGMLGGMPPELEKSYREREEWAKERRERAKRIGAANLRKENEKMSDRPSPDEKPQLVATGSKETMELIKNRGYMRGDDWRKKKLGETEIVHVEGELYGLKKKTDKKAEFEQLKRNIATGIGTSPEKVEFVNRWLAYLIKELKGIKDRDGKERLAAMCIAALADEAGIKPDRERPSYIG